MSVLTEEQRIAYGLDKLPKLFSKEGYTCYAKFYIPGQPLPEPDGAEYFETVAEAVETLCMYDARHRLARGPSEVFLYLVGSADADHTPWIRPDNPANLGFYIGTRGRLKRYTYYELQMDRPAVKYHQRIPYTPPAKYKN